VEFFAGSPPTKQGLGSSAAVCVALTGALLAMLEQDVTSVEQQLALHQAVHHRFQGRLGSGIDVASSLMGGVISYQLVEGKPVTRQLDWPSGLFVLAVWTGESASTPEMLRREAGFRDSQPALYASHLKELTDLSTVALSAWSDGNVPQILQAVDDCAIALERFDAAGSIRIFSRPHQQLHSLAGRHGAVYKPSGAGGGDCGLVLTDSATQHALLREEMVQVGYLLPSLKEPGKSPGFCVESRS
jgi:phosphomevalonate kinase